VINIKTISILNIPFHAVTATDTLKILQGFLAGQQNRVVVTPNPEAVMRARQDGDFKRALLSADLCLADGVGILLASKFIRDPVPERVTGGDASAMVFKILAEQSGTVFLLGAAPGVAEEAKKNLERQYKNLRITGLRHGYFNNKEEELSAVAEINRTTPDVLILGMGMPRQELFAQEYRDKVDARITLCVGGLIDVWGGKVKRAPAFMCRIGLEWLWRLLKQPSRAKRMLALPRFVMAVVTGRGDKPPLSD
jgi:N-acetylglucosaminyldiphosphoundecaprenol N-acetyl-beta-D-mannosaminyltransferase